MTSGIVQGIPCFHPHDNGHVKGQYNTFFFSQNFLKNKEFSSYQERETIVLTNKHAHRARYHDVTCKPAISRASSALLFHTMSEKIHSLTQSVPCVMGRFSGIPTNIKRFSCILIGCISLAWYKRGNILRSVCSTQRRKRSEVVNTIKVGNIRSR